MRGRKPNPTLNGPITPVDFSSLPPVPEWLDDTAKSLWARLGPLLASRGLLDHNSLEAFAGLCECWGQWRAAIMGARSQGMTVESGTMLRLNPLLSYAKDMAKEFRSYCGEFGLTPATREKAGNSAPVEDDLEELLQL